MQTVSSRTVGVDVKRDVGGQQVVVTDLWVHLRTIGVSCVQLQNPLFDEALGNLGDVRLFLPLRNELVDILHSNVDVVAGRQTTHMTIGVKPE